MIIDKTLYGYDSLRLFVVVARSKQIIISINKTMDFKVHRKL